MSLNGPPRRSSEATAWQGGTVDTSSASFFAARSLCVKVAECCCRYDLNEWVGFKLQMNLAPEAGVSQGMVDVDLKVRRHLMCLTAQYAPSGLSRCACQSVTCQERTLMAWCDCRGRIGTGR